MRHGPTADLETASPADAVPAAARRVTPIWFQDETATKRPSRSRALSLLVLFGVALIAATVLTIAVLVIKFRDRALSDAERELANIALILAKQSDRSFQAIELVQSGLLERIHALGIVSSEDFERRMSGHDVHLMLRDRISGLPHVDALTLVGANGKLINFSRYWPIPAVNVADRDYFQALKSSPELASMISEPVRSRGTGNWTIYLARRITAPDGQFLGVTLAAMELLYFERFFGTIALGPSSSIALLRNDGTLLVRYPRVEDSVGRKYSTGNIALAGGTHTTTRIISRIDDKERVVAWHALASYPLIAAVGNEVSAILGPWRQEVIYLLGAGGLVTLVICLVVGLVAREMLRGIRQSQARLQDEKRKLDAALQHMSQGLCMFDAAQRLVLFNQRYLQMYGLSPDAVKPGSTFREIIDLRKANGSFAGDCDKYCAELLAAIGSGEAVRHFTEADDRRVIEIVSQPMAGGGWISTHNDITRQRGAEEETKAARAAAEAAEREARAAHATLLDAFEVVPEGLALFDAESRYVLWNKRYGELYAASIDRIKVGARFEDVLRAGLANRQYPDAEGREEEWLAERLARLREAQAVHEQRLPGDRWLRIEERRTADGGSIGVRIDITDLKRREASFRLLFEDNPLPMYVFDIESLRFVAANDAALAHYGYAREQFLGMTVLDIRPPEERGRLAEALESDEDYVAAERWQHLKADGSLVEVEVYSRRFDYEGRPAWLSVVIDITERRRAERERDRNRGLLDLIVENVPPVIFVRDARDNRFVLINRAAEQLWGMSRDQVIGKTPRDIFPAVDADVIAEHDRILLQSDGRLLVREHAIHTPNNGTRLINAKRLSIRDAEGAPRYLLAVLEDLTESRAIERQLQHARKMEAVGNLTGGLAHDFNNLLTVIIGNLDLLLADVAGTQPAVQKVETILEAAERGADLTHQMLAFSRRQPLNPRRIDINELIGSTTRLLARTLGENITINLRLADDLWPVVADAGQLEAALVNIAINARDAMPTGGVLTLTTGKSWLDAEYAMHHPDVMAGDYVMIELRDTGIGMPPSVLAQIFEPFFTTKEPGKGTGLGLSMVYGFMQQSGGHVGAESRVGEGTTFRLYLPRAAAAEAISARPRLPIARPVGKQEVILAVDDNPVVLATAIMQLRELGYHVLEAENAESALDVLDGAETVDLLFTDIIMPGPIGGRELAVRARLKRPGLKVLFTSGFPGTAPSDGAEVCDVLLGKPYRKHDLADAVHQVLHAVGARR